MPAQLELFEQATGAAHHVEVAGHALGAAVLPFGDEAGTFQHGDVLLYCGKRHLVARGEFADGRIRVHDPRQDVAARGVGQRTEQLVEHLGRVLPTYNHLVVHINRLGAASSHNAQRPDKQLGSPPATCDACRVMRHAMPWSLVIAAALATTPGAEIGVSHQPGQGVIVGQLAAGTVLVAARNLPDPNFTDTVVLLIEYSADGAAGLVLNRSSGVPLSRALPSVEGASAVTAPAFIGGPVSRESLLALSRAECDGCVAVARDVHLVKSASVLTTLLADGADERRLRVYVGYAGWGTRQLEAEVRQGAWRVLAADARIVFDPDPSTQWRRMIERSETVLASLLPRW